MRKVLAAVFFLAALGPGTTLRVRSAEETLEALFQRAVQAEGEEYLRLREQLLARGAETRTLLSQRQAATAWQERLLAEILLERMDHAQEIHEAVTRGLSYKRSTRDRGGDWPRDIGVPLAERFKKFPLVLVEFLWKGNELLHLTSGTGKTEILRERSSPAWVIYALGFLREKRAWPVLMGFWGKMVDDHFHNAKNRYACLPEGESPSMEACVYAESALAFLAFTDPALEAEAAKAPEFLRRDLQVWIADFKASPPRQNYWANSSEPQPTARPSGSEKPARVVTPSASPAGGTAPVLPASAPSPWLIPALAAGLGLLAVVLLVILFRRRRA